MVTGQIDGKRYKIIVDSSNAETGWECGNVKLEATCKNGLFVTDDNDILGSSVVSYKLISK